MDEDLDPGNIRNTQPANAMPFVVALVGFLIVAVLAFVFLREDDSLTVVRPDEIEIVDDSTIEVFTTTPSSCGVVDRAQVDQTDDDRVFVELVVDESACDGDQTANGTTLIVELPEPIGDRRVIPGVGRRELPCTSGTCRADQ